MIHNQKVKVKVVIEADEGPYYTISIEKPTTLHKLFFDDKHNEELIREAAELANDMVDVFTNDDNT